MLSRQTVEELWSQSLPEVGLPNSQSMYLLRKLNVDDYQNALLIVAQKVKENRVVTRGKDTLNIAVAKYVWGTANGLRKNIARDVMRQTYSPVWA